MYHSNSRRGRHSRSQSQSHSRLDRVEERELDLTMAPMDTSSLSSSSSAWTGNDHHHSAGSTAKPVGSNIMETLLCRERWSIRNAILIHHHDHHHDTSPEIMSSPCSSVASSLSQSSAENGPSSFLPQTHHHHNEDPFSGLSRSGNHSSSSSTSTVENMKIDQKKGSYNKNMLVPEFKETSKEFKGTKLAIPSSAFQAEDTPNNTNTNIINNNNNNMRQDKAKTKAPAPREGGSTSPNNNHNNNHNNNNNSGVVGSKKRKKDMVTKEQIVELFHLRIKDAAELLNMSTTSFKKVCRENDIVRWPFKKKAFCERIQNQWQATKKSQDKPKAKTAPHHDMTKAATPNDACDSPAAATSVASPSSSTRTLSNDGDMLNFKEAEGFCGSQDFETKMQKIIEGFRRHVKESETTSVNSHQQYLVTEDLLSLQLYLAQQRNNNNDTTLNPGNCNFFRN